MGAVEEFWEQTPRTFSLVSKGVLAREERQHRGRAWVAWHIAALLRFNKRLPKLETLVGKAQKQAVKPGAARKSPDELLAKAAQWAAHTGQES